MVCPRGGVTSPIRMDIVHPTLHTSSLSSLKFRAACCDGVQVTSLAGSTHFSLRRSRSRSKSSRGPDGLAVVGVAFLGTRLATFVYVSKLFFFAPPLGLFFPL